MTKRSLKSPNQPLVKRQAANTPKFPIAHQQQQVHSQQRLPDEFLKSQQEYDVATAKTWCAIGQCASTFHLYSLAAHSYEASLRHAPDNVDSLIGFSKSLKSQDANIGLKQSTELLLSSIQRFPHLSNDASIWKELSETHLSSNQAEEAHQAITRSLSINANDPHALLIGAECLIRLFNFQHATMTLHSIIQSFTNKTHLSEDEVNVLRKSHYKLAQLAYLDNNLKLATSELKSALSLPPFLPSKIEDQASLWTFLITVREKAGDIEDAFKTVHDGISSLGLIPKLLIAHAYLLLLNPSSKTFDPLHAITLLESAIKQTRLAQSAEQEIDFLAWYLLGKAHSAIDQPREAYDAFQIALRIGPSSSLPWLAVGSLYLSMGQLPDALAAYSQAARLLVDDNSIPSATASAAAWDGLSCVYERCDDQAHDAADACLRASSCFRAAGDFRSASQFEQRAHSLTAASRGQAPMPLLRGPPEAPTALLRELVGSGNDSILSIQPPHQQPPLQGSNGSPNPNQVHIQQGPSVPQQGHAGPQTQLSGPPPHLPLQPQPQQQQQQLGIQAMIHQPTQPTSQQQHPQNTQRDESSKQFHHLPLPRGSLAGNGRTGSQTPEHPQKSSEKQGNGNRQVATWSPAQNSNQGTPQQPQQQGPAPSGGYYYDPTNGSRSILITNGPPPTNMNGEIQQHAGAQPPVQHQQTGQPGPPPLQGPPILVQHQSFPPPNGQQQGFLPPPGFSFTNGAPHQQPLHHSPVSNQAYVPWR